MLASVAEQAGLSLTWSETPEDTFSHDGAQLHLLLRFWEHIHHINKKRWSTFEAKALHINETF